MVLQTISYDMKTGMFQDLLKQTLHPYRRNSSTQANEAFARNTQLLKKLAVHEFVFRVLLT